MWRRVMTPPFLHQVPRGDRQRRTKMPLFFNQDPHIEVCNRMRYQFANECDVTCASTVKWDKCPQDAFLILRASDFVTIARDGKPVGSKVACIKTICRRSRFN